MVLEIEDIEGMFPLYVKIPGVPSAKTRKLFMTKNGVLHMT